MKNSKGLANKLQTIGPTGTAEGFKECLLNRYRNSLRHPFAGSPVSGAQSWREPADPREKARDRIQMVRMLKMTEALHLDRDTAARFFAIGSRYARYQTPGPPGHQ